MEIVTMDNEVVKAMMAKIDRIAAYVFKKENVPRNPADQRGGIRAVENQHEDAPADAEGPHYPLRNDAEQMPLPPRGLGGMCEKENRAVQPADAGRVPTELPAERKRQRRCI